MASRPAEAREVISQRRAPPRLRHAAGKYRALMLVALVAACLCEVSARAAETGTNAAPPRQRITLNEGWRYADGPIAGAHQSAFDDGAWSRVDLPHTWNAVDAFGKDGTYRRGEGWYRRALRLESAQRDRRLFLYFEGANQVAELFVNSRFAGTHVGGYTAFVFEITDLITFEAPNQLAVRVDNRHDPDIPPLNVSVERAVCVQARAGNGIIVRLDARPGETIVNSLHLRRR